MAPEEHLLDLKRKLTSVAGKWLRWENLLYNRHKSPENASTQQQIAAADEIIAQPQKNWLGMVPEILQQQRREEAEKEERLLELLETLNEAKFLRFENELTINFPDDSSVDQRLTLVQEILAEPDRGEVGLRWEQHRSRRLRERQT